MGRFRYKILVVEDEQMLRESIVGKINGFSDAFTVIAQAQNGAEALELIVHQLPDIVITDIVMPVMDGLAFAEALKARHQQLPIIIMSGFNEFEYAKKAMSLGVRDYLLKPIDDSALHSALHRLVQELEFQNVTMHQSYFYMLVNNPANHRQSGLFDDKSFRLALLVAGNNMAETINADVNDFFDSYWEQVSLTDRCASLCDRPESVHIQKGQFPAEQLLLFDAAVWEPKAMCDFLKSLHAGLNAFENHVPTSAWFIGRSVLPNELYEQVQKIKQFHYQNHVPWTAPFKDLTALQRPAFVSMSSAPMNMDRLASIMQTMNEESLACELQNTLTAWHEAATTQSEYYRRLVVFLHSLERLVRDRQIPDWQHILNNVHILFATSAGFAAFSEETASLLASFIVDQDRSDLNLMARIMKYIDQNYTKPISLFDVAKQHQISPSYLARQFKHVYGESPSTYIILVRIEEAKRLIRDYPALDFRNIAELVGYPDQHYFSKLFKKLVGLTPTEFKTAQYPVDSSH